MNPGIDLMGQLRGVSPRRDLFGLFFFFFAFLSFCLFEIPAPFHFSVAHSTRAHSDQLCGAARCINLVIVAVTEVFESARK